MVQLSVAGQVSRHVHCQGKCRAIGRGAVRNVDRATEAASRKFHRRPNDAIAGLTPGLYAVDDGPFFVASRGA